MSSFAARCVVCALTLVAVVASQSSPVRARPSAQPPQVTQLTVAGHETSPVYSPDSGHIAFVSYRDSAFGDVFVMNADGSGQTKLTNGSHGWIWEASLSWSPGGKQILFVGQESGTDFSDIFAVDADASESAVNLTNTPDAFDDGPRWSPDGQRIVFSRSSGICVMNADGSGVSTLTDNAGGHFTDVSPAWSPTAQQIAFARLDGLEQDGHICVMRADGSHLTQLTDDPAFVDLSPRWSPSGRAMSFVRGERGGTASIFVMDRDGGSPLNITSGVPVGGPGVWSPNGRRIAFASENLYNSFGDIYAVNPDGTGLTNLTGSVSVLDYGPPSWSRNGLRLIFWSTAQAWPLGDIYAIALR